MKKLFILLLLMSRYGQGQTIIAKPTVGGVMSYTTLPDKSTIPTSVSQIGAVPLSLTNIQSSSDVTNVSGIANFSVSTGVNSISVITSLKDRFITINGITKSLWTNPIFTISGGENTTTTNASSLTVGTLSTDRLPNSIPIYYNNIAALKMVRPITGTIAYTYSYSVLGDGGGAKYRYDGSSTAANDEGSVLLPTTSSGSGRWLLIPEDGIVLAKQFGVKADYVTNDHDALQAAIDYCMSIKGKGIRLILPCGVMSILSTLNIGTDIDPIGSESSFAIEGQGMTTHFYNTYSNANYVAQSGGTLILYRGPSGIGTKAISMRRSSYRYMSFSRFSLLADGNDACEVGWNCEASVFSMFKFDEVQFQYFTDSFRLNKGGYGNGEFTEFHRCRFEATRYAYWQDAGQALSPKFLHCLMGVERGGTCVYLAETSGGTFIGTDASAANTPAWIASNSYGKQSKGTYVTNFGNVYRKLTNDGMTAGSGGPTGTGSSIIDGTTSWAYVRPEGENTLIALGGPETDPLHWIGGRSEHIGTPIKILAGANQPQIEIDGLICASLSQYPAGINIADGTDENIRARITIRNSVFNAGGTAQSQLVPWKINIGTSSTQVIVENSTFGGFNPVLYGGTVGNIKPTEAGFQNQRNAKVQLINCLQNFSSGTGVNSTILNKVMLDNAFETNKTYRQENLLVQSNYGIGNAENIAAASPWVHTGVSSFLQLYNAQTSGGTQTSFGKRLKIRPASGVYQNINAVNMLVGWSQLVYYKAQISYIGGNRKLRMALVNATTGTVYDEIILTGGGQESFKKYEVTLKAWIPSGDSGILRFVQQNLDVVNDVTLDVYWQHIYQYADAKFVPTTTTTISKIQRWDDIMPTLKVTARMQIPYKDDAFGSDGSLAELEAEKYISSNTLTEKTYTDRWEERPRMDRGTAVPTSGTWPVGFIRYNTTPTPGGYIGWVCVTSGSPGIWKGFGLIAN